MERLGGGLFLRALVGAFIDRPNELISAGGPGSSPLACLLRDSIIWRCLSRTSALLCSWSRLPGLWIERPGERQAMASSWPSLMGGRAVSAPDACVT